MMAVDDSPWPALAYEERVWTPDPSARGTRADRTLGAFRSALVPAISHAPLHLSTATRAIVDAAEESAAALRSSVSVDLAAMTGALLRSESVASSKIEHLSARQDEVALAVFGVAPGRDPKRARAAARAVAANVAAMTVAVAAVPGKRLRVDDILEMHRVLLEHDALHASEAGRIRTQQNWIGGSDFSPRGALFVPPAPGHVPALLTDLAAFTHRTDVSPVVLAAIAHAQFETIHPFIDGNGRTGRALVHSLWRRTGFTGSTVIPVSTVLLTDVDAYFAGLGDYRDGDLDAWVGQFAAATSRAAMAGQSLGARVVALRDAWLDQARPRRGSAVATLLDVALRQPVLDIDAVRAEVPADDRNRYLAVDRLVDAGVLAEVTGQGRHRIWFAPDVFALLEDFEAELGRRTRPSRT